MAHTLEELRAIAASGGGMTLDASKFSTADLRALAASANGGGQIFLRNLNEFSVQDLRAIAASGGGRIVFDFLA